MAYGIKKAHKQKFATDPVPPLHQSESAAGQTLTLKAMAGTDASRPYGTSQAPITASYTSGLQGGELEGSLRCPRHPLISHRPRLACLLLCSGQQMGMPHISGA